MENIKVDVIIPAYHPGKEFSTLIERLTKQTFPIHRIIVMNTEETYWNKELEEKFSILEVHHLKKQEFDHGATRACAAELSDADVMVFMTQDALPADKSLIENLVKALTEDEVVKAALGNHIYTSFVEAKRIEWASYATFVSQWEVDNYLDLY